MVEHSDVGLLPTEKRDPIDVFEPHRNWDARPNITADIILCFFCPALRKQSAGVKIPMFNRHEHPQC